MMALVNRPVELLPIDTNGPYQKTSVAFVSRKKLTDRNKVICVCIASHNDEAEMFFCWKSSNLIRVQSK